MRTDTAILPSDWRVETIGNCCDILDGRRIPVNEDDRYLRQGTVPYYGANGQQGWIDDFLFDEELVLIAEDGGFFDDFATRPIAYMIAGKSWVNNHAHVLRAKSTTSNSWVFYNLVHRDIRRYIGGGTRSKLNQSELAKIEIPFPTKEEQRRIAFVLDTIDELIAKTEAVIAKLKQVRAGLLHDLLTRGLDENGGVRDPIAHPEQFKDSPLGRIPKEWEIGEVATLCELGRGRVISQLDLERNPGIYPVYSSQSENNGVFGYLGTYDFEGDYVTWTTDGANAGTVFYRTGRFNCTNVCGTLRSKGSVIESFVALAFGRVSKRHVSYVGNPKLMNNTVGRIRIAYPRNINEQKAIVKTLTELDEIISAEESLLNKQRQLKLGLMSDLLTGRVRVPEGMIEQIKNLERESTEA